MRKLFLLLLAATAFVWWAILLQRIDLPSHLVYFSASFCLTALIGGALVLWYESQMRGATEPVIIGLWAFVIAAAFSAPHLASDHSQFLAFALLAPATVGLSLPVWLVRLAYSARIGELEVVA